MTKSNPAAYPPAFVQCIQSIHLPPFCKIRICDCILENRPFRHKN